MPLFNQYTAKDHRIRQDPDSWVAVHSGTAAYEINEHMRRWRHDIQPLIDGHQEDIDLDRYHDQGIGYHIMGVNHSLEHAPHAMNDFHVYTGISQVSPQSWKKTYGYMHLPAFTSTSDDPRVAAEFGHNDGPTHIIRIRVRKGQRVGGYIQHVSRVPHEREFLMKSNLLLKIHPGHEVWHSPGIPASEKRDSHFAESGSEPCEVHIHDATIMEPHEVAHISGIPEIDNYRTHMQLLAKLKAMPLPATKHIKESVDLKKHVFNYHPAAILGIGNRNRTPKLTFEDMVYNSLQKLTKKT